MSPYGSQACKAAKDDASSLLKRSPQCDERPYIFTLPLGPYTVCTSPKKNAGHTAGVALIPELAPRTDDHSTAYTQNSKLNLKRDSHDRKHVELS